MWRLSGKARGNNKKEEMYKNTTTIHVDIKGIGASDYTIDYSCNFYCMYICFAFHQKNICLQLAFYLQ